MKTLTVILLLLCVSLAGSNAYAVGNDEYVAANFGSPNADLVRVEWPLPFDEETQTQPVYEPITFDVEQTDMDGVVTIHQQTVGTII